MWCVVCGVWCVVCGVWCVGVCGVPCEPGILLLHHPPSSSSACYNVLLAPSPQQDLDRNALAIISKRVNLMRVALVDFYPYVAPRFPVGMCQLRGDVSCVGRVQYASPSLPLCVFACLFCVWTAPCPLPPRTRTRWVRSSSCSWRSAC